MHRRLMKCTIILALLLISTASLTMAAPVAKNDGVYSTNCGEELSIDAPGLLANDRGQNLAVASPELVKIANPKYGTVVVDADGSFVYTPPNKIASGTYVTFGYTATDGISVSNRAYAKIQVTCTCDGKAPSFNTCVIPETEEELKDLLIANGAGCVGCDNTGAFDLSEFVFPLELGCYDYSVICSSCLTFTGTVCFGPACECSSEPFTICPDVELTEQMIRDNAALSCGPNCLDVTPAISNIHLVDDHWEYTITCDKPPCEPSVCTGIVEISPPCEITSLGFCLEENCPDTLPTVQQILENAQIVCSCGDDTPEITNIHWVTPPTEDIRVGEYTITCEDANGCITTATGGFDNECCGGGGPCDCQAYAPDFCFMLPVTADEILAAVEGSMDCTGTNCDATPTHNLQFDAPGQPGYVSIAATGNYFYTVTCIQNAGTPEECRDVDLGKITIGNVHFPCPPG